MVKNPSDCENTYGPNDGEVNGVVPTEEQSGCTTTPSGDVCPTTPADKRCKPFQLSTSRDSCFIDGVVNEALNIGGADLNVYKLLGVHEQCKLIDATGNGEPLSSGDGVGFPAANAFDKMVTEWHSKQTGDSVVGQAFIGYDFGEIKLPDGSRRVYGEEASIRKHITAILIKQSANTINRVTKARVERSEDGVKWYGVQVVDLPDDDCLNTILLKNSSVHNRFWRLRPLAFNGGSSDYWGVQALQLVHNFQATHIRNIQDKIFLENSDRDYADVPTLVKGSYDLIDINTELSKFGIELPAQSVYMTVNFSACVAALGRPLVIGDIIELPSEAQFSAELELIEKWLEVTDVAWSTEGYTPGWKPTLQRIILQPAYVSQETQDIFGDLAELEVDDGLGLVEGGDGNDPIFQDYSDVSQEVRAQAKEMVPQSGREMSSTIRAWEEEEVRAADEQGLGPNPSGASLQRIGLNPIGLYAEDAMPPNGKPFSEGTEFPDTPTHGDYHRLTFEGLSQDIPARLFRYSSTKGRWIFLEKDRRAEFDPNKPRLQEFLVSPTRRPHTNIVRDKLDECDEEDND